MALESTGIVCLLCGHDRFHRSTLALGRQLAQRPRLFQGTAAAPTDAFGRGPYSLLVCRRCSHSLIIDGEDAITVAADGRASLRLG